MKKIIRINSRDNVAVALADLAKGDVISLEDGTAITITSPITRGHKIALCDIKSGEDVIKYGYPIGYATEEIKKGSAAHVYNIRTKLAESGEYSFSPLESRKCMERFEKRKAEISDVPAINVYHRKDGRIAIRNSLWIIPTVGCVNEIAKRLEKWGNENLSVADKVHAYTHPFGCSQLGDDHENTRKILSDLVHHPNAGGVLVLSLGCENNTPSSFKEYLGPVDPRRVRFLTCQDVEDEEEEGRKILKEIADVMKDDRRSPDSLSRLVVAAKCGGSDGLSGITANPLVGRFTDEITAMGGTMIMSEVPEMFGAEQMLMNRAESEEVFSALVSMINGFKSYFTSHGQSVYENPSPGNKAGGISTLEDKSLGCVQKGGDAPVTDILSYGERVRKTGLNLLTGPGNDIVSTTAETAAGAHIILFTTGRGTPLGAPVPTIKIATNEELARKKKDWIDFDASRILREDSQSVLIDFINLIIKVANGEVLVKNEINGYSEISIFKDGVTL